MLPLINPDNSCCFTGHRPSKLPWKNDEANEACVNLKLAIDQTIDNLYQSGIHHFICGMALGCDLYFAEAVMKFKESNPNVTFEAAVPCENQADSWNKAFQDRYYSILKKADDVTVLHEEYTPNCMLERDRYMVDHASVLIAAYGGKPGGSRYTINYAKKKGLEIFILDISNTK